MDINMVLMLLVEFRGAEEEVAQMCLGRKEVVFEKPKESSQHLKPLYVWGHINGMPISRMLVNDGAAINLMLYSIFKKFGREDDELMKTNLTLNGVGGNPMEARGVVSMELNGIGSMLMTKFGKSRKTEPSDMGFWTVWFWQFQNRTKEGAKLEDLKIQVLVIFKLYVSYFVVFEPFYDVSAIFVFLQPCYAISVISKLFVSHFMIS
jgi:hypothetical protein